MYDKVKSHYGRGLSPLDSLGQILKRRRKEKGLIQKEVAEKADISMAFLSALERGEKTSAKKETIKALANALDLSERELLIAAGFIADDDKKELLIQFDKMDLLNTLRKFEFVLLRTLEEMKKEGSFEKYDNDYRKVPANIINAIHKKTGALEFTNSSDFIEFYDSMLRGELDASEVVGNIFNEALLGETKKILDNEKEGLERDIEPYIRNMDKFKSYIPLPIKGVRKSDSLIDIFNYPYASRHRFNEQHSSGLIAGKVFDFPINDLHFHLTDSLNKKLYKSVVLSNDDREQIIQLIESFLLRKYVNDEEAEDREQLIKILTEKPSVRLEWEKENGDD